MSAPTQEQMNSALLKWAGWTIVAYSSGTNGWKSPDGFSFGEARYVSKEELAKNVVPINYFKDREALNKLLKPLDTEQTLKLIRILYVELGIDYQCYDAFDTWKIITIETKVLAEALYKTIK